MHLRVTILGSGTIIPSLERHSTSLLVEAGGEVFLFDCGPGALEALENHGLSFRSIKKVLFTHFHPDHSLGIGHLLAAVNNDRDSSERKSLTFYGPRGLAEMVKKWNELYPSTIPKWDYLGLVEIGDGDVISCRGATIRSAGVDHGDCAALAYRVDCEDTSVVYTGDTSLTESLVDLARDTDLLVSECSFPDNRPMKGHMTPSVVGRLASMSSASNVVLVHLYPVFGDVDPAGAVKEHYGGPVVTAQDGMVIDL